MVERPTKVAALGDQAALAYFGSEAAAVHFAASLTSLAPLWLHEIVPAYASVGVYFDAEQITIDDLLAWLTECDFTRPSLPHAAARPRHFTIPVCYERHLDLADVAKRLSRTPEQVIALHTMATYRVYAIGFVPGFPYLGYVAPALAGLPRLASPRLRVPAGSVGLTGQQTGIYPLERPGGWPIIGQTPLCIVDVETEFFPLRVGDEVQFTRINETEYNRLQGERLLPSG